MNWILKLFKGKEFLPLSSYDDFSFSTLDYCFNKVMEWITSCRDFSQMKSAKNLVELFKKQYPKEHKLGQDLKRKYQQIKRGFINN